VVGNGLAVQVSPSVEVAAILPLVFDIATKVVLLDAIDFHCAAGNGEIVGDHVAPVALVRHLFKFVIAANLEPFHAMDATVSVETGLSAIGCNVQVDPSVVL
jgi:hypothetical protein